MQDTRMVTEKELQELADQALIKEFERYLQEVA